MTVLEYITEEVTRQGSKPYTVDHARRVDWMLEAWDHAVRLRTLIEFPKLWHIKMWGYLIEREYRDHVLGWRQRNVQVGDRPCPEPGRIPGLMCSWHEMATAPFEGFTPSIDVYKAFEEIHPFCDGNGRVGKIILNWWNGTLDAPIFPPNGLWGHPIRNP